ncbi:MAG: radical SAM protein [Pacificimonas sp.]|jgi:oxygen-independent coproporphyrinogen-3 oxidase|nr:radical SAM protein [Pacificimonas sp.]
MWTYHPDLLDRPVPRYTSFPTAAEFGVGVGADAQMQALRDIPDGADVSLYLHIPFCEKICWYCGCNTARANRRARLTSYLAALSAEIALVGSVIGPKRLTVRRIAFGGGSPNAVRPFELVRLLYDLTVWFGADSPRTSIELDPRSHDAEWVGVLRDAVIEQASLGVQTFDPALQAAIGRVQDEELIAACVSDLRAAGVSSLNFDLMYGLPGQTNAALTDSIERTIAHGADRVALFGYAHVPSLLPRQRQIDATALPGSEARFEMAALGHRLFTAAGYEPVGFDHFALPADGMARAARNGTLRRNFQGFTDDSAEILIGLGASAISQFPGLLVQNEKNSGRYRMRLSGRQLAGARGVERSEDDQWRAAVIEDILCRQEANLGVLSLGAGERAALRTFQDRNLVTLYKDRLRLLPAARPYARAIAATFDPYRQAGQARFSNAV